MRHSENLGYFSISEKPRHSIILKIDKTSLKVKLFLSLHQNDLGLVPDMVIACLGLINILCMHGEANICMALIPSKQGQV